MKTSLLNNVIKLDSIKGVGKKSINPPGTNLIDVFEKPISESELNFSPYRPSSRPVSGEFSVWENLKSTPVENFINSYIKMFPDYKNVVLDTMQKLSKKTIKETFTELENLEKELPPVISKDFFEGKEQSFPSELRSQNIMQLLILKANQPETYNFLINNSDKKLVSTFLSYSDNHLSGNVFQTLTKEQINIIKTSFDTEKQCYHTIGSELTAFCQNSDDLTTEQIRETNKYLSQFKFSEDFTAYRGERDSGLFSSVPLDKSMTMKIKSLVLLNSKKAKNTQVSEMNGKYQKLYAGQMNLYDYIMNKKELTLADAMQVMKYGNENFQNEVIELIKKSKITDTRFKSLTFDRQMAKDWLKSPEYVLHTTKDVSILQNVTVKSGLEGCYADSLMAETVLNNNPKIITFQNVKYDKDNDMFILDSTISRK